MLIEVIDRDLIISELRCKDKEGVIREMASKFSQAGVIQNEDSFINAIRTRENIESTAIGGGIAIPHARSDTVEKLVVALGRSSEGVDFASLDGKPVHLIFMIGCSSSETKTYLQVLARIARLCKNKKMRESLMSAKNVDAILCFLKGFDIGSDKPEPVKLKDGRMIYPSINFSKK
ncbi:MAG: PTS sugar transporter subunit IIA [Candidatus Ratteibacteria bacterium]|nr:PTS sugar transporter subunit IIA [Candidatus Ratteibacteria bacterium]